VIFYSVSEREILTESQHNFHFLPYFNSKNTGPIFTIFSHDLEQLVEQGDGALRFRTQEKVKTVNFDVFKNPP